jgi:hypothetical protein
LSRLGGRAFSETIIDELVKGQRKDDFVKSSRCKARKNWGVRSLRASPLRGRIKKLKHNAADGLFTKSSKIIK